MMRRSRDILLGVMILAGAAYGALWIINKNAEMTNYIEPVEAAPTSGLNDISYTPASEFNKDMVIQNQEIRSDFETIINKFLAELSAASNSYREKRVTVKEVLKPENMQQFAYVKENTDLATEFVIGMENDMNSIIQLFEIVDQEMERFLTSLPPEQAEELLVEWNTMKTQKLAQYVEFFASEKQLLKNYTMIMNVYLESKGEYNLQPETGSTVFKNKDLQAIYESANNNINAIIADQKEINQ